MSDRPWGLRQCWPAWLRPRFASHEQRRLLDAYGELRHALHNLEQAIGDNSELGPIEGKRLDKALVLAKLGAKGVKKVLRQRERAMAQVAAE